MDGSSFDIILPTKIYSKLLRGHWNIKFIIFVNVYVFPKIILNYLFVFMLTAGNKSNGQLHGIAINIGVRVPGTLCLWYVMELTYCLSYRFGLPDTHRFSFVNLSAPRTTIVRSHCSFSHTDYAMLSCTSCCLIMHWYTVKVLLAQKLWEAVNPITKPKMSSFSAFLR